MKIYFMSNPKATAADRRTWLVRKTPTGPSYLVRIYPDNGNPDEKLILCDCTSLRCNHIQAAIEADNRRFPAKDEQ